MGWAGEKIKAIAKERKVTLTELGHSLSVSRQAINAWIKGQVPRGQHLVGLCKVFNVAPDYFFPSDPTSSISIPLHRTRGVAKLTKEMESEALEQASKYETLFKNAPDPGLVQVYRVKKKDSQNAINLSSALRELCGIESGKPLDYQKTFELLSLLNIVVIFCEFPVSIKSYAFYCRIHEHRVVFINTQTNVLDLIFPILHEAVHAICDEDEDVVYDPDDEDFCDEVANAIQFPNAYVHMVSASIAGRKIAIQVNMLKDFSGKNGHAMYGIFKQIKKLNPSLNLNIGGADSNLKKEYPTIGEILFKEREARDYVHWLNALSPNLVRILVAQIDSASNRRISEWLGLDSSLDGKLVIHELKRLAVAKD
jgi:transcriptional regulator with XRE-family HTH domain